MGPTRLSDGKSDDGITVIPKGGHDNGNRSLSEVCYPFCQTVVLGALALDNFYNTHQCFRYRNMNQRIGTLWIQVGFPSRLMNRRKLWERVAVPKHGSVRYWNRENAKWNKINAWPWGCNAVMPWGDNKTCIHGAEAPWGTALGRGSYVQHFRWGGDHVVSLSN